MNENKVTKRLGKEYEKMLKKSKKILSYMDDNKNINFEVKYTEKLCLRVIIDNNYPFTSPNVFINNKNYCNYIQSQIELLNGLTTLMNIPCPCCYNVMNSWSPGFYLTNVFEEFENSMKLINTFHKLNYIRKYVMINFKRCDSIFILKLIYNYLE